MMMIRADPCRDFRQLMNGKMLTHKGHGSHFCACMQGGSWPAGSMAQHMGASPMQSPRLGAGSSRQALKPLVHSRTVLQETMREVSLLLICNTPTDLQESSASLQKICFHVSFRLSQSRRVQLKHHSMLRVILDGLRA